MDTKLFRSIKHGWAFSTNAALLARITDLKKEASKDPLTPEQAELLVRMEEEYQRQQGERA